MTGESDVMVKERPDVAALAGNDVRRAVCCANCDWAPMEAGGRDCVAEALRCCPPTAEAPVGFAGCAASVGAASLWLLLFTCRCLPKPPVNVPFGAGVVYTVKPSAGYRVTERWQLGSCGSQRRELVFSCAYLPETVHCCRWSYACRGTYTWFVVRLLRCSRSHVWEV